MTDFAFAEAADADAETLAARCADKLCADARGHTLGFLYATAELAGALGAVVEALRRATGIEDWVGTVGLGVCATGTEHFAKPAMSVMTANLPGGAHRIVPLIDRPEGARDNGEPAFAAGLGVVHGDPRNQATPEIVRALAAERGAFLVGGLSASDGLQPQVAGTIADGGVSGVLIAQDVPVAVGLSQGCSPVGTLHEVTEAEESIIISLDGRPAFEVLLEDVGVAEGADPRPWLQNVHAAKLIPGTDTADYLVRNLVGIEPKAGLVVIGDAAEAGETLLFVRRDADAAAKDLQRMLDDLKLRAGDKPKGGLYFSCVARGPNLFQPPGHELTAIKEAFGDFPLAGFFGNGEISHDRLYGYTGVLVLFL
jgi:small ligand-binding sensory domain FIST